MKVLTQIDKEIIEPEESDSSPEKYLKPINKVP